jgi:hypothetical protein
METSESCRCHVLLQFFFSAVVGRMEVYLVLKSLNFQVRNMSYKKERGIDSKLHCTLFRERSH